MLPTRSIPIYGDYPDDWHTFLYKASKGSIKAVYTLDHASMAYMIAITGDPESPNTMHLDDYNTYLCERFPAHPPVASIQELHDTGADANWFPQAFRVSESPRNPASHYRGLWGRMAVNASALLNDAMLLCLENWSSTHMIECTDQYDIDYDARLVTSGMLYLSLTWPGTSNII